MVGRKRVDMGVLNRWVERNEIWRGFELGNACHMAGFKSGKDASEGCGWEWGSMVLDDMVSGKVG